jgi:hypothetical protein
MDGFSEEEVGVTREEGERSGVPVYSMRYLDDSITASGVALNVEEYRLQWPQD